MCEGDAAGLKRRVDSSSCGSGPAKRERSASVVSAADVALTSPGAGTDADSETEAGTSAIAAYESFVTRWGLGDDENAQVVYQVYSDLRLIRKWTSLSVGVLATGRGMIRGVAPAATDAVYGGLQARMVIPVSVSEQLTLGQLHDLCEQAGSGGDERCVTMAIVDDDSTTAYYRMFTKWDEITSSHWKQKKERAAEEADGEDEDEDESSESE